MAETIDIDESELEDFRKTVRAVLETAVQPHYAHWEKDGISPRELWNTLGENGLLAVDVPEEYGGFGAPFQFSTVVVAETARMGFGALATSILVHSDIVAPYIFHIGSEDQKQHWLGKMVSGEAVGAIVMTEPGAGSDLQNIRTSAIKEGDSYIINGSKTFITNGQQADLLVLAVKTDPKAGAKGISLFLVDTHLPGCHRGRNLEKLGLHSGDTSELFFEDLRVPEAALLGELNKGFGYLIQELARERLIMAVNCIASTEGALQWTLDYVTERKAFGSELSKFQNTRFKLAEIKTQIEINKAFLHQCIKQYMQDDLDIATAAMVKLSTSEMQGKAIDECLQLFGGYGYMMEYPIARALADARVQRIYGGTSEIMKEIIARSLVGK